MHGVIMVFLVIIPSIPAALGLRSAASARGQGCGFPEAESPILLHLCYRFTVRCLFDGRRGGRYRLDLLYALLLTEFPGRY